MLYRVEVAEVHKQGFSIEAENPEHAAALVDAGEGELLDGDIEYSHSFSNDEYKYIITEMLPEEEGEEDTLT